MLEVASLSYTIMIIPDNSLNDWQCMCRLENYLQVHVIGLCAAVSYL